MSIIKETEKIIAQLPPRKASMLRYWLKEFQAARRYKQLKAYKSAFKARADFEKNNGISLLN